MKSHWGDSRVRWERISDMDAEQARLLEEKEPVRRGVAHLSKQDYVWRCTRCQGTKDEPGLLNTTKMHEHLDAKYVVSFKCSGF